VVEDAVQGATLGQDGTTDCLIWSNRGDQIALRHLAYQGECLSIRARIKQKYPFSRIHRHARVSPASKREAIRHVRLGRVIPFVDIVYGVQRSYLSTNAYYENQTPTVSMRDVLRPRFCV